MISSDRIKRFPPGFSIAFLIQFTLSGKNSIIQHKAVSQAGDNTSFDADVFSIVSNQIQEIDTSIKCVADLINKTKHDTILQNQTIWKGEHSFVGATASL